MADWCFSWVYFDRLCYWIRKNGRNHFLKLYCSESFTMIGFDASSLGASPPSATFYLAMMLRRRLIFGIHLAFQCIRTFENIMDFALCLLEIGIFHFALLFCFCLGLTSFWMISVSFAHSTAFYLDTWCNQIWFSYSHSFQWILCSSICSWVN